MTSGRQPSRALLIAAGSLTQAIGFVCLVLALASLPIAHDLKSGLSGVLASVVASLAAIICGTFVWWGRLVPLSLAAGLDIGFGIGLPRGGSAIGAMLRILPADEVDTAETIIMVGAVIMFIAAVLCVLAVPSALALRRWAREELARDAPPDPGASLDDAVPTRPRPRMQPAAQTIAAATPQQRPSAGSTLRGFGAVKVLPTQIIRIDAPPRSKPLVIAGVAITVTAIGIIIITAATGPANKHVTAGSASGSSTARSGSGSDAPTTPGFVATKPIAADAGSASPAAAPPPPFEDLVSRFHTALTAAEPAELTALFEPQAFAFGVEANDLAEGRDAIVAQLRADLGTSKLGTVTPRFSHVASDGNIGLLAEELRIGNKTFIYTAVAGLRDNTWTIGALHWAQPMPNDMAYRLARSTDLAIPDAVPDAHDASPLAHAMRTAFASKPSFVAACSTRTDAFNFGSAGERLKSGDAIKRIFGKLEATIRLHDAVKVGMLGDRGGWGVANVDFTDADRDGTEVTQTFRVLAAWIKEDAGWRIVMTQWSNPR